MLDRDKLLATLLRSYQDRPRWLSGWGTRRCMLLSIDDNWTQNIMVTVSIKGNTYNMNMTLNHWTHNSWPIEDEDD